MSEITIDAAGRPEPPLAAGELATLTGFLDYQRATLEWKTRGLDIDALRARLPPSSITLAGLLAHLRFVEDYWFAHVVGERPPGEPWASVDWRADPDWDWHQSDTASAEELREGWAASVEASRGLVARLVEADADALDRAHPAWGARAEVSLRWVLVHMIEEYARHNGHADLVRESVDGQTGE